MDEPTQSLAPAIVGHCDDMQVGRTEFTVRQRRLGRKGFMTIFGGGQETTEYVDERCCVTMAAGVLHFRVPPPFAAEMERITKKRPMQKGAVYVVFKDPRDPTQQDKKVGECDHFH